MNETLALIYSLRKVLESIIGGKGVASSLATELRGVRSGREVSKSILLGFPVDLSLRTIAERKDESALLASLVAMSSRSSVFYVGKKGEELSHILERWVKEKETRILTERVSRFRGLIISGVLGGVMAMLASVGPLLGSLALLNGQSPPQSMVWTSATMTLVSSGTLGLFLSGRKLYLNVLASALTFSALTLLVGPLMTVTVLPML